MPCYCIVLNCQTPSRAKGRSYCRIPAIITNQGEETQRLSEERRRLWLAAINRGELTENTLQHARVCGAHFVSGKAAPLWNRTSVDWVPTLNLRLQTISVDEERAQERAWRQFTKRRRREAGHQMIGAHSIEEKHSSGAQAGGDTTAPSTSKRARVSDSLQHGGEDLHGAGDHVSEEDSTPMVGTLGFSKETTLALLNRMFTEELLSELNRRSIVVKPAGGDRPRGRSDLEHVLREVMTREYEEAEGNSGTSMDTSNTSSTFEHSRSDASSSFEHSSRLDEETSGSEVFSGPNNEQAPTDNIQEPTMMIQQTSTSRQAADMNISEAPSTSSAYPVEVLVKKEPVEDVEYCVATSSSSSNIVASTTEPSTSQTGHPGIGDGSQGRLARNLSQAERIKTESEVEEGTEDIEQEDLSSEHCPSSPRQLSQELDKVEVSTEDEGDAKPSTSTEEPVKLLQATSEDLPQTFASVRPSSNESNCVVTFERPRKRVRTDMSSHYPILNQYYEKGMQNTKDEACRKMITEVAQKIKLPELNVKNWIYNTNKERERQRRGEEKPSTKKRKRLFRKRKCGAYNRFMSWYLKGKSGPNVLKDAAREYERLKKEDPEFLKKFQEEAEKVENNPKASLQELDSGGKKQAAQELYKVLQKTVTDLHTCGWDGVVKFYDHNTKKRKSCGTPGGNELFESNSATDAEKTNPGKEDVDALKKRVQELMNRKWCDAILNVKVLGKRRRRFPYGLYKEGKIVVEGLPDGVTYQRPSEVGALKLKTFLKHMDNIVIRVIDTQEDGSPEGQDQESCLNAQSSPDNTQDADTPNGQDKESCTSILSHPDDTLDSESPSPSVDELLAEVSSGLAQAGQGRGEISIDP
ncbi:uncharacterized protein LOC118415445 isoform X5 [Branchiostoma floridae]|uniref:Uncharacterized protein LOC118415445 isoform X5 n=1 Tax=Branchiostoma floridae TaxID=7739 RepID=A0A9J7L4T5_BRAFL|nr:uncharacterized protein LOC118415445 isoform X5 [Branchiostoma floridae]